MTVGMVRKSLALAGAFVFLLSACAESPSGSRSTQTERGLTGPNGQPIGDYKLGKPYTVAGVWYYPKVDYDYLETGIASWYGPGFNGEKTANGETYDQTELTAAHRTLPMPSMVRVSNLENGRSVVVRINDRGPFKNGRIIDLSKRAAELLEIIGKGTAKVRVTILPHESRQLAAIAQSREAAASAPLAAPVVGVAEVQLEPAGTGPSGSVQALESAVPALSAPFGSAAAAMAGPMAAQETETAVDGSASAGQYKTSWLIEREDGEVVTVPRIAALSPQAGAASGTAAASGIATQSKPIGTQAPAEGAEPIIKAREVTLPWPDGKVRLEPVRETSIFVQAGSFLRRDNASRLSVRLKALAKSHVTIAQVGQRMFFRVRLGPVGTVDEADHLLNVLLANGISDARVIVD